MNTKTTFEDRLLSDLQREIELREVGAAEAAADDAPARVPRLVTPPRIALAAAACAAAALAVVLVPGSPADSTAYAVERHGDGSVTLTLKDLSLGRDAQRELAERLGANGIHVDIQDLDGTHCEQPRGESLRGNFDVLPSTKARDSKPPQNAKKAERELSSPASRMGTWKITLHRGDTLAFENYGFGSGKSSNVSAMTFYAVKGTIKPCVPVELPDPIWEVTDAPPSDMRL
ncbi:hypothetical protein [Streptomyces sp. NBC_01615]|uniref:hypothetical protein n=1 Tax=Streptomyces sp. NBC_01615 TaxID=2975898 RepID=UPI00386D1710